MPDCSMKRRATSSCALRVLHSVHCCSTSSGAIDLLLFGSGASSAEDNVRACLAAFEAGIDAGEWSKSEGNGKEGRRELKRHRRPNQKPLHIFPGLGLRSQPSIQPRPDTNPTSHHKPPSAPLASQGTKAQSHSHAYSPPPPLVLSDPSANPTSHPPRRVHR
ncbi:hypothetical protein GE09DRAFT_467015 [Coniochaeta sp. 2T2.1]|nr:hypothetical protein GE09DRAFT_467015 [Coniochaeta sp. 2T2.1]